MKTLEKDNSIDGFRALGDPIRLAILVILETGTRCVCDIQSSLSDVAPNLLSHHLRVLREAGLVQVERRGRWMDYRLDLTGLERLRQTIPSLKVNTDSQAFNASSCITDVA